MFFPPESAEQSSVLLVYDPLSSNASRNPVEKTKHLSEVEKELTKLARDAADVKSQVISVDKKWHTAVLGKDGTTLNAYVEPYFLEVYVYILMAHLALSEKTRRSPSNLVLIQEKHLKTPS